MACWVNKVTDTHTEYVWSSTATVVNANASQCYVYTYIASRFGLNLIVIWKKKRNIIFSLFSDGSSPLCIYNKCNEMHEDSRITQQTSLLN